MLRRSTSLRAVVFFVVPALVLGACGGGDGKSAETPDSGKEVAAIKTASLVLGKVRIESAGPPVELDKKTRKAVLDATQKYIDTAVHNPLRDGAIGKGYGTLFDSSLRKVATGSDQDALTEMPVGKVKTFTEKAAPMSISGLADNTGAVLYLATHFTSTVKTATADEPITLTRSAELTFAPAGNSWTVVAYRVVAVRKAPKRTTTTTAQAEATTA